MSTRDSSRDGSDAPSNGDGSAASPVRNPRQMTTIVIPPGQELPGAVDLGQVTLSEADTWARYEVGELLGAGGMGEVHACRDSRIGRTVALKRTRTSARTTGSAAELRARFLREARIQGQLEHPAVAPVYDLGEHPEGGEFFTMKRVRGRTLSEVLRALRRGDAGMTSRYSRQRLLSLFNSVCLAVHYAHSRGVVHRDLKPDNLMLGDFGEVYVLDWGVAKVVREQEAERDVPALDPGAGATVAGAIIGTPGYLAPEVLEGHPVDGRADVYALGAILVEILTFEPLHSGNHTDALVADTLLGVDVRERIRASGSDVPPELESLCVLATARERDHRLATALEVQLAVQRFLDGDRDLELRREQARAHAATAEQAALEATAQPATLESRRRALYEAGRALALDPDNELASSVLLGLLSSAPPTLPAEAETELEAAAAGRLRTAAKLGAIAYAFVLLFVPAVIAIGVLDWSLLLIVVGLFAATSVTSLVISRLRHPGSSIMMFAFFLSIVAIATASSLLGVYGVLLPAVMAVNVMAFAQHRSSWLALAITAALGLIAPIAIEWLGAMAPAYEFDTGRIIVHARTIALHPIATQALIVTGLIATVFVSAAYSAVFQRALTAAERRLQLQNWQLAQLVGGNSGPRQGEP